MDTPTVTASTREASFWPLQLAGWLAFGAAMASSRIGRFPWGYMIASKSVMTILGIALTAWILRPLYRRTLRAEPGLAAMIAIMVVASYLVATAFTAIHGLVDIQLVRVMVDPRARITNVWQIIGGTLYHAFVFLAWSVLYVGIKHQRALYRERERAVRAESLANAARLEALRLQLNPHFLFNALNAISTLIVEGRQAEASRMLARVGDLLRTTLARDGAADVPLAEELDLVQRYLDIEQIRLGDRLALRVDVGPDAWHARVPSLLLQPLVENAVRHAIAPREQGGAIAITARRENGNLRVVVEDDGPGLTGKSEGIGLANTRERLRHRYPDAHRFALTTGQLGGLRVDIELPFESSEL
jgi:LytS/YehU family sensor histidine kinase